MVRAGQFVSSSTQQNPKHIDVRYVLVTMQVEDEELLGPKRQNTLRLKCVDNLYKVKSEYNNSNRTITILGMQKDVICFRISRTGYN
jgi:hypothetical protein